MISWIQNHLIRHGRWIFITLLVVIIVAFVFTIGNTPGCTTNRSNYVAENFYGYDLNAPIERQRLTQKTNLSQLLASGRPIQNNQQMATLLPTRIALLHLADQIGVPGPTTESLGQYLRTRPLFLDDEAQFSADLFTRFTDTLDSNPEMPENILINVLEEDYRIEQVRSAMSDPGFVLPAEIKLQTERNKTTYLLSTASLKYDSFVPKLAADTTALEAYYEKNKQAYQTPERLEASYAFFPFAQYLESDATLDEATLRKHFESNREQFVADYEAANPAEETISDENAPEEAAPAVTFEEVKETVTADYRAKQAERAANDAAQSFAFTLYDQSIERSTEAFQDLLKASGIRLQKMEPFALQASGSQNKFPAEMRREAFALKSKRDYTSVYQIEGGFALIFVEGRIAAEIPPLDAVITEVTAAYEAEQKRALFNEEGERLKQELESGIAEGATFEEAAAALGLEHKDFEGFTFDQAPRELNRAALEEAGNLETGALSDMITTRDQTGLFVYLKEKNFPQVDPDDEAFTSAKEWLENYSRYLSSASMMSELVDRGSSEATLP